MTRELKDLKELLNNGDFGKVRKHLGQAKLAHFNRAQRLEIAAIARRVGMPELTLMLLNRLVRHAPYEEKATAPEKVVYAGALIRLGAVEEALTILQSVDAQKTPDKYYFEAHAWMSQWEYAKAIVSLTSYLRSSSLTPSEIISGWINLAAAQVHERHFDEALPLLEKLERLTTEEGLKVRLGNTLELWAQMAIAQKDWKTAEEKLRRAQSLLDEIDTVDRFFVRKWFTLLEIERAPNDAKEKLLALRKEAVSLRHWESVRDCDLRLSVATNDKELFGRVYFGTPFEAFRKMALRRFPLAIEIPETFQVCLGRDDSQSYSLNLPQEISGNGKLFKAGRIASRLLALLFTDFYRPLRVGSIFGLLYPGQFFNPESSRNRVHQSISSLKTLLKNQNIPLRIDCSSDGYRIEGDPFCRVIVARKLTSEPDELRLSVLREAFKEASFTARQAALKLNLSPRSVSRLLQKELTKGTLSTTGRARTLRYEFNNSSKLSISSGPSRGFKKAGSGA